MSRLITQIDCAVSSRDKLLVEETGKDLRICITSSDISEVILTPVKVKALINALSTWDNIWSKDGE